MATLPERLQQAVDRIVEDPGRWGPPCCGGWKSIRVGTDISQQIADYAHRFFEATEEQAAVIRDWPATQMATLRALILLAICPDPGPFDCRLQFHSKPSRQRSLTISISEPDDVIHITFSGPNIP